jgi:hypothetical protein
MTRLDALRAIVAQPAAAIRPPKPTQPADYRKLTLRRPLAIAVRQFMQREAA